MSLENLKQMVLINEAGLGFFAEAKHYNDASEFSDEFYDLFGQVTKMKKIMKNPKWIEYMRAFDRLHPTSMTERSAKDAIKAITELENNLKAVDTDFDRSKEDDAA